MKKYLFYLLSHISAFTIGCYVASQFKFKTPIEDYRWMMTGLCLVIFVIAYHAVVHREREENGEWDSHRRGYGKMKRNDDNEEDD